MKYDIAVFDMDGTILDTLEDLKDSLNFALKKSGYPERTIDEVRRFVGNGIGKLIERGVPSGTEKADENRVYSDFTEHYKVHCYDKTKPYEGIAALVENLKKAGCRTAVVSNKADYAVQELCVKFFDGMFDCSAGEKKGTARKPEPDAVNEVLKKLDIPKEKAVYIGDSDVDIQTAKNAGIDSILVDWGFRDREFLKENGAEIIVSSADEIEKIILS
ncbi:MAG: HAD family hydrolase [Porcipelethomonas sp.]